MKVSDFCSTSKTEYEYLIQQIDTAARRQKSYDFPSCTLPHGSHPASIPLSFGKIGTSYFIRANASFTAAPNSTTALKRLSAQTMLSFPDAAGLTAFLQSLAQPETAAATAASAVSAPTAYTEEAEIQTDTTTENICIAPETFLSDCRSNVKGQDHAIQNCSTIILPFLAKYDPERPISLFFFGPTGVGKTELAKTIQSVINAYAPQNQQYGLQIEDMTQYEEAHSAYRLIGAPPGYVGHGEPILFDALNDNPRQIFVFDEAEKAHPAVLKVLMRALDEGKHSQSNARSGGCHAYDLKKCILIFTSNLSIALPRQQSAMPNASDPFQTALEADTLARTALRESGYLPELIGRIGRFVAFAPLSESAKIGIAMKIVEEEARQYRLEVHHISSAIIQELMQQFSDASGARAYRTLVNVFLGPCFCRMAEQQWKAIHLEGTLCNPNAVLCTEENTPMEQRSA